jgi:hypothetical protein
VQELRAFLEIEGSLSDSYQWRQLHPLQGSLMEGLSRLPKQLLGARAPACSHTTQTLRYRTLLGPMQRSPAVSCLAPAHVA